MFIRGCVAAVALMVCATVAAQSPARAQAPAATVQLHIIKGSYIIGASGGSGVLFFQGQAWPLGIGGLSIGLSIGGSTAELIGEVYNLSSPYDIEGIYGAVNTSYAVAGGDSALMLRNARGVELRLRGKQIGLEFSLDLSGISISIQ